MPHSPDTPTEQLGAPDVRIPDASEALARARRALLAEQLRSREGIAGLRAWRAIDRQGSGALKVRRACDAIATERRMARETEKVPGTFSARVDEFVALLGAQARGEKESPTVRPEVLRIAEQVRKSRSEEGEVDVFDLLTSDAVPAGAKARWFEAQLASVVRWLEQRDLADARAQAEQQPPEDVLEEKERAPEQNVPPPASDTLRPTMDERERAKEGEPGAWFTIRPPFGGYWREQDYDVWNGKTLEWEQLPPPHRFWKTLDAGVTAITDESSRRVVSGTIRAGSRTHLPMPVDAGFVPDVASLRIIGGGSAEAEVLTDGRGGCEVYVEGDGLAAFSIEIGKGRSEPRAASGDVVDALNGHPIGAEAQGAVEAAIASGEAPYEQARQIKRFVKQFLTYSNDSSLNAVYRGGDPNGYFERIEQHKKADCDVGNTYAARLLAGASIPFRMVDGHYVKTKDRTGAAVISSGTGHAWLEVWDPTTPGGRDGGWHRLDATPLGDPNMDEGEPDEMTDDAITEGDFGEEDVSSKELEEMIREAQKELDKREQSAEVQQRLAFAAEAGEGCTEQEAAELLQFIKQVRNMRDREGRNIRDRLITEFSKIVKENIVERPAYRAPVRMSRGAELEDPVAAVLDLRAGSQDPTGFGRSERKVEREQVMGGMDVVLVADKSGSMSDRWREQQATLFLIFDALNEAADQFKRYRVRLLSPVDVQFGLVSFRGKDAKRKAEAEVELPLGSVWGPKEQLRVWRALQGNVGGGTPDHLGMEAAEAMLEVPTPSRSPSARGGEKERVQVVLEYSDGGSDDATAFAAAIAVLRNQGIVADSYRQDLSGFPSWVAEHIIAAAAKLKPKRVKK
ncbi:MAG: transglutaminase domain-containing protein [Candidatus Uhrbacteria bacterium]